MFINDVDGFRRLMQKTGAIIIGESAEAQFKKRYTVLICANSWFSFLKGETIGPAGKFPVCSLVDERVCFC